MNPVVPFPRHTPETWLLPSEWDLQLACLQRTVQELGSALEICLTSQSSAGYADNDEVKSSVADAIAYYQAETPLLLADAMEALEILRKLSRAKPL